MDNIKLLKIEEKMFDACVDLYMDTFSKEPWFDVYDSRNQALNFFTNHYNNNYFVGYGGYLNDQLVALSIGMKKPWIKGFEYYIDEFCVSQQLQGKAIGSWFIKAIEDDIKKQGMNAIILNTEKDYPAQKFYEKNGFKVLEDLIFLAKG